MNGNVVPWLLWRVHASHLCARQLKSVRLVLERSDEPMLFHDLQIGVACCQVCFALMDLRICKMKRSSCHRDLLLGDEKLVVGIFELSKLGWHVIDGGWRPLRQIVAVVFHHAVPPT